MTSHRFAVSQLRVSSFFISTGNGISFFPFRVKRQSRRKRSEENASIEWPATRTNSFWTPRKIQRVIYRFIDVLNVKRLK